MLKVTPFVTERGPEQRGSYTFLSCKEKPQPPHQGVTALCPQSQCLPWNIFKTTTVKHLERLSRRKKNYKNHTTKIYSRNVFPKLTLHSQNF